MRQIRIIGSMVVTGAAWGVIAGGAVGAIVGIFVFVIGALVGIPIGIIVGLLVGVVVGLACGLTTVGFDLYARSVTPAYRVSLAIVAMLLTPILVVYAADEIFPGVGLGVVSPAVLVVLSALLALPISQKLVNVYRKYANDTPLPAA